MTKFAAFSLVLIVLVISSFYRGHACPSVQAAPNPIPRRIRLVRAPNPVRRTLPFNGGLITYYLYYRIIAKTPRPLL